MRVVIASDSFKESLSALAVCQAIADGVRDASPDAEIVLCPMADGGEGTVDALVDATGGERRMTEVRGPLGEPVDATWGMLGEVPQARSRSRKDAGEPGQGGGGDSDTAVIEMAAASGLPLVPVDRRDPTATTTFGTGQLVGAALDAGARRILLGIGGSATNDGGCGCAQAVGVKFLDEGGNALPEGLSGGMLQRIGKIDMAGRDPRLNACRIEVACDVDNPLCGPRGASAVYGPQKGATPDMVEQLDAGLRHLAGLIERDIGCDVRDLPGAGAAGGLGAGLVAFLGATLRPGIDMVTDALALADKLRGADLVITGEGRLDEQSMMGKVVHGVGRVAREANVPVVAICGSIGPGAERCLELVRSYFSIVNRPMTLDVALTDAPSLLRETAGNVVRTFRGPTPDHA